ncbi:MAG: carbohydrate kinase [Pseudorhodobacter sp.]|nr:carbohydrate kinase [Pseudorhodobacter sp.]
MGERYLGIDLGTTSVKAAILSEDGARLAQFGEGYATSRPGPGMVEQDPADWMRLIGRALHQFSGMAVGFGCLSSQVNTHVFVDAQGQALAPAILWQDTRAAAEAAELDAQLSHAQKMAWLGAPIPVDASHPLARMLWMARHRPEVWAATAQVLLPKDYCLLHLTGRIVTDPLANVGLVGPDLRYVKAILDLVPGAAQRMAPLAAVTEVVGRIGADFGLARVQMVNGTMDGWAGLFGAGCSREGAAVWLSGTSEVLGICADEVTGTPGVVVFPAVGGLRLHAGPTQSGGASQMWFCQMAGMSVEALTAGLEAPRRSPTPLFLPQLAGERAPLWDSTLRGAFLGLDSGMTSVDLGRAVLEGVALSARHVTLALEASAGAVEGMTCGGGGFRSEPWGQIRADILGKPLTRLAVNQPVILGSVAMAMEGAGAAETLAKAQARLARYDKVWMPDPARRALYDQLFGIYLEAVQANAVTGHKLASLQ